MAIGKQKTKMLKDPLEPISVSWTLAELPTPQHRAGLAGLAMMVDHARRYPLSPGTVLESPRLDATTFELRLNGKGLEVLMDRVYAADLMEVEYSKLLKNRKTKEIVEPLRRISNESIDKKGKTKTTEAFVYPQIRPQGGVLSQLCPVGDNGLWIKLWQDWLWNTLRAKPTQRIPYNQRAKGSGIQEDAEETDTAPEAEESGGKEAETAWSCLTQNKAIPQASTYYLGAMDANAESVPFQDRGRFLFLLHFWPFAIQVFVPRSMDWEGKLQIEPNAFLVSIPDICDLEGFIRIHEKVLKGRSVDLAGFRPAQAVIDLPEAAALETDRWYHKQLEGRLAGTQSRVTLGFQVIHTVKEGNNVNIKSIRHLEPTRKMRDDTAIAGKLWNPVMKRLLLENVLESRRWWEGSGRICATHSTYCTISSKEFRHDASVLFETFHPNPPKEHAMPESEREPRCLEALILHMVTTWIQARLESKYQLSWDSVKDHPGRKEEYEDKKSKLALDAFLAARSRPGREFSRWFTSTLCSVNQRLTEPEFVLLSQALDQRPDQIRSITLLALSARG